MGRSIDRSSTSWIRRDKRVAIYLRDGVQCAYCGASTDSGAVLSLDHIDSCGARASRGLRPDNRESNLVTCCTECNSARQDEHLPTWLASQGRGPEAMDKVHELTARPLKGFRVLAKRILAMSDMGQFNTYGDLVAEWSKENA